jgi:hypothetical protein
MATVDKNFKVKNGLVVEGTTATVNGEDILTTASSTTDLQEGTNLYFTAERAAEAVADEISTAVSTAVDALDTDVIEEGETNLYFTNQRALDATSAAYDAAGAADTAEQNANDYTDTAVSGKQDAITAGDGLVFDGTTLDVDTAPSGGVYIDVNGQLAADGYYVTFNAAEQTLTNKTINGADNDITIVAADVSDFSTAALSATASAYDAAGAAATAEGNANDYTDTALESYTPTSGLDTAIDGLGYLKDADLSGYATETYVNSQGFITDASLSGLATETYVNDAVDALVDGAPGLLDTLNEIAAAINDDANYATTMTTALAGKQNELTSGDNISIVSDTISVTGLDSGDISDFNTAALSATASAYDAAGSASAAQTAAEGYADGLAVNYEAAGSAATAEQNAKDYADETFIPLTQKGVVDGVATLDENGKVPANQLNLDVSGDIQTAIDALDTDDIEEGSTNLYFTDTRAVDALEAVVPNFTDVEINSIAKQVAATGGSLGGIPTSVYSFEKSAYRAAKFIVKIDDETDTEVSEVLLTLDSSDNIAITEYAVVGTNGSMGEVSATISGSTVQLRVTPVNASTIKVVGTLLA